MLALVLPAWQQAEARTDISVDFFYDNLGDGGNWVEVGDYGYCWQPSIAVSNTSWRPYSDGYWAYTDVGWTWVSYEDFGWATYHYGRWMRLRGRGWVWMPGREWGPAWVSWRTGGDYVGWAPLPPRQGADIYAEFRPINSRVDLEFDIGPAYYNFIDVRYIGEPVLRERIFAADQNVTYITKTVNVTNITYTNNQVYNYGPDYNTLSRYSTRPIQKLSLQRETNADPLAAARSKSLMKVQGDKLVIAAPQQFQKPTRPIAPKVVKEKVAIAQAPVERGWEPVGDQKAQAELKEKMKKEDPKTVPPSSVKPREESATTPAASAPATSGATATPATSAAPAASTTPALSASPAASASPSSPKDKNKRPDNISPAPSASVAASPAMTPEKNKNKRNEKVAPGAAPSASVVPGTSPAPTRDKGKNKQPKDIAPSASVPPASGATDTAAPSVAPKPPKEKTDKRKPEPARTAPPSSTLNSSGPPPVAPPKPESRRIHPLPPEPANPEAAEKPKRQTSTEPAKPLKKETPSMERVAPRANAPANPPPARDDGKKQKKNEPATAPTP